MGQVLGNARQRRASLRLTRSLQGRYGIETKNVIGHAESLASLEPDVVQAVAARNDADVDDAHIVVALTWPGEGGERELHHGGFHTLVRPAEWRRREPGRRGGAPHVATGSGSKRSTGIRSFSAIAAGSRSARPTTS